MTVCYLYPTPSPCSPVWPFLQDCLCIEDVSVVSWIRFVFWLCRSSIHPSILQTDLSWKLLAFVPCMCGSCWCMCLLVAVWALAPGSCAVGCFGAAFPFPPAPSWPRRSPLCVLACPTGLLTVASFGLRYPVTVSCCTLFGELCYVVTRHQPFSVP